MDIGNKDIYEYISNFADDRTIINMIGANPKVFDNEKFYEKIMRKRYPLLIEFRKPLVTWREFYLRMIYTLSTLQEQYQIPYIPTKGCDPQRLLASATSGDVYNEALKCAAAGGNIPLIENFLQQKGTSISDALFVAAKYSNLNTVNYLISKGGSNRYENIFEGAAAGGNVDIMKFALDALRLDGFDINGYSGRIAISNSIDSGNVLAVEFLVNNGATVTQYLIERAENKGKQSIAEYLRTVL